MIRCMTSLKLVYLTNDCNKWGKNKKKKKGFFFTKLLAVAKMYYLSNLEEMTSGILFNVCMHCFVFSWKHRLLAWSHQNKYQQHIYSDPKEVFLIVVSPYQYTVFPPFQDDTYDVVNIRLSHDPLYSSQVYSDGEIKGFDRSE